MPPPTPTPASTSLPALSLCICTRNRPDDLAATLRSIEASVLPVNQIIVSDDGDPHATRPVVSASPLAVEYTEGPRSGLAANRNHVLTMVTSPYVLFLDDDCRLSPEFTRLALSALLTAEATYGSGRVAVTGVEYKAGVRVEPADQDFLGFQRRRYSAGMTHGLCTVVINAAIFRTSTARATLFDPRLRFGSEEVDFTTRLVASGTTIVLSPDAANVHVTSDIGRADYNFEAEASRLYVTFKRYAFTDRRPMRALAYAVLAPVHLLISAQRGRGYVASAGAPGAFRVLRRSLGYVFDYLSVR